MRVLHFSGILAALLGSAPQVQAATCKSPLLVDDFSGWLNHQNNLQSWVSDDGTMPNIAVKDKKLTFAPAANSFFYETFTCQAASNNGYSGVSFTLKGPAGGSLALELQYLTSCTSTAAYKSSYYTVSGLTGDTQVVTVPWSAFSGANPNAITAFTWSAFSATGVFWEVSQIQLACSGSGSAPSSAVSSSAKPVSSGASSSSAKPVSSGAASSSAKPAASSSVKPTPSSAAPASSSAKPTSSTAAGSSKPSTPVASPSSKSTGSIIAASTMVTSVASSPSSAPSGQCTNVLIDDWTSQSRLTFLFYNAMLNPSSDDATMTSVVVNPGNRMTLTPKNGKSYFYSQLGCMNAKNYGGISLRIKAAAGSSFSVELDSGCGSNPTQNTLTTAQLGWTFDGTEQLYNIDFSKFSGLDLSKLQTVLFSNLKSAITLGPMQLYCGNTVAEYIPPTVSSAPAGGSTVPAPSGTAAALVIDNFSKKDTNALGFYHGADDGMTLTWGGNSLKIVSPDSDYAFYTQVSATCRDMTSYDGDYLHIAYSGSNAFTVALQQHNPTCNEQIAPYPETWDSLEAARYSTGNKDIYIPMSHFNIARGRVIGLAFKGFYTQNPTTFTKVEIVPSVPAGVTIPNKLPSGQLMFACKRPNSFAFAIDDGDPTMAQQVLNIIKEENIKVTFFTVGAPLLDPSTNLSNVYNEMMSAGHQIALHSYTHPKMEGLPSYDAIDWEYNQDIAAVQKTLNGLHTPYFRPPFGNEGARMRQRLANSVSDITDNPYIVNWSVDVEDWLWATSSTPEKQLDAFQRDVSKGGNLVVLHYLYPSTVGYLQQFIQIAKATGKQLMRVDQCMMDPNAPPL
ncbi:hydrolase-like protein [Phyllosticta capitalensis]|uniref:hydrolase-like protein n=1 Tax=Phyllosticta capitalensis TaxID=121624 RepID=UPI00312CF199